MRDTHLGLFTYPRVILRFGGVSSRKPRQLTEFQGRVLGCELLVLNKSLLHMKMVITYLTPLLSCKSILGSTASDPTS